MKSLLLSLLLCLAGAAGGSGCASIVASGPDNVEFTSVPPGASVLIDGKEVGQTPVKSKVSRKAKLVIYQLAGYEDTLRPVQRHFNGMVLGNILFGGLIGIIIDYSTGNASAADAHMHAVLRMPSPPVALSSAALPQRPAATRDARRTRAQK